MKLKNWESASDTGEMAQRVVRLVARRPLSTGQRSLVAWLRTRDYLCATYLLLDEQRLIVKIGTSSTPQQRVKAHQRRWPRQLTFLGFIPDTGNVEREIHRLLRDERAHVDSEAEWSHWSPATQRIVARALEGKIS